MAKCVLCGSEKATEGYENTNNEDYIAWKCPRCGEYEAPVGLESGSASGVSARENRFLCSAVSKENSILKKKRIRFTYDQLSHPEKYFDIPKTVPEKVDRMLLNISRIAIKPGEWLMLGLEKNRSLSYSENVISLPEGQHDLYLKMLVELKYLEQPRGAGKFRITHEGWKYIGELEKKELNKESKIAFVAMWFDDSMNDVYENAIEPAIRECGFESKIVRKEHFLNTIDDEIISLINKSRFVVVDITGNRQAVYYEAGYAKGLGLTVIYTCKDEKTETCTCKDGEIKTETKTWIESACFDTNHYQHILWKDLEDLKTQLINKIRALIK